MATGTYSDGSHQDLTNSATWTFDKSFRSNHYQRRSGDWHHCGDYDDSSGLWFDRRLHKPDGDTAGTTFGDPGMDCQYIPGCGLQRLPLHDIGWAVHQA